jgi:hypothetical protein
MTDTELGAYIMEYYRNPPYVQKYDRRGEATDRVVEMPTMQGVCWELGLTKEELRVRCEGSVELRRVCELVGMREYDLLMKGGLGGSLNSGIVGLTLQSKHGFSTKSEGVVRREVVLAPEDLRLLEEMGLRVLDA